MSVGEMDSVLSAAQTASVTLWEKEKLLSGHSLANINNSLVVTNRMLAVNVSHWIDRSRGSGAADAWNEVLVRIESRQNSFPADFRFTLSVHMLDESLRYWMRETKGLTLLPRWVEQHLRGLASHAILRAYDFFVALGQRCRTEILR
jgi:hypothetical protein